MLNVKCTNNNIYDTLKNYMIYATYTYTTIMDKYN